MPYYKDSAGNEYGITLEELFIAVKYLFKSKEPHINYDVDFLRSKYPKNNNWLKLKTHEGEIIAPYLMIFDYRHIDNIKSWGKATVSKDYDFPAKLAEHKKTAVELFGKADKLKKGNRPCPHVSDYNISKDNQLKLTINKAWYYDQVGTNLTPDLQLSSAVEENGKVCNTVRDWDLAQSSTYEEVPSFSGSKLANTIGVAIGITAEDEHGKLHVLKRKRSGKVAMYEGQWHVPFSFALAWSEHLHVGDKLSLNQLILPDYGHEFAEELKKFEITDFEPARPLAFCRDMVRAGKPQFFFEIRSRIPLKKLLKDMKSDGHEYVGKAGLVKSSDPPDYSPELVAYTMLTEALG